ncbi:MAG: redoxin domain-containing protein [Pirellulaceae bacterium]|nr:redoxin domain-containing protein [Pirellulaceae bacterium]
MVRGIVVALVLAALPLTASADKSESLVGRKIDNFTLKDFRGKEHSLSDFKDNKLVVAYFFGTECPLAKLYSARLQKMSEEYADKGVAIIGINSNVQDNISEIESHVVRHKVQFPALKDVGNVVADMFGATRTPEIFVLDQNGVVQYTGRVDGQYTFGSGVGLSSPVAKREDLKIALDELLAGKAVSEPTTVAKGCIIGRVRPQKESEITYSNQIARILQNRCVECHREGQIAPFAMTDYEEVAGWGEMILETIEDQRMPPWHADPAHGEFANEQRLTATEKQQIRTWVDAGCPEGNPADMPEPLAYHEGWYLPEGPDEIFYMSEEPVTIKAEGTEPYRYFTIDPGFKEDKWVTLAEALPGNPAVVHHIIAFVQPPNSEPRDHGESRLLVGFAPGTRPQPMEKGWAKRIPAGSKLVFQMHYTPIGSEQTDRSMIGLVYCDESEVTHRAATSNTSTHDFVIPPGAKDYEVVSEKEFERDTLLTSLFPHMHIRGSAFKYEMIYPDGKKEILLDVPVYDFNWQNHYILKEPKFIPKGSKMVCTALFDNSLDNLANPDPTDEVRWGDQTWEEMMIGWHDIAFPIASETKANLKKGSGGGQ